MAKSQNIPRLQFHNRYSQGTINKFKATSQDFFLSSLPAYLANNIIRTTREAMDNTYHVSYSKLSAIPHSAIFANPPSGRETRCECQTLSMTEFLASPVTHLRAGTESSQWMDALLLQTVSNPSPNYRSNFRTGAYSLLLLIGR
jgi:hypothetical protein